MSIFDLKKTVDEFIGANEGMSRMYYNQVAPTRDVVGTSFSNGAIHFRFELNGTEWWVPSRSYMRFRIRLQNAAGAQLTIPDGIAPNMNICANLFQSCEMRINGKTIGRVSDFMPQVDMLEKRLTKSKAWIDSIGASTQLLQAELADRQRVAAADFQLNKSRTVNLLELGYNAANTTAFILATNLLTIEDGAVVNSLPTGQLLVGDILTIKSPAAGNTERQYRISKVIGEAVDSATYNIENILANKASETLTVAPVVVIKPIIGRNVNEFELIWKPPLNLFKIDKALPAGKYELVLNPQTSSQLPLQVIESLTNKVATDFKFEMVDMYLNTQQLTGPRVNDATYFLDLEQTRCQTEDITINNAGLQQKGFDVSPSSYALTLAFQDNDATGSDTTKSASKFKIGGSVSEELKLERMFINYAGQNLPQPDADPQFSSAGIDYTAQRYTETQLYSGAYYDAGGAEKIEDWHERGAYYYFSWPRDGTDVSTRVRANFQFGQGGVTNGRILLFDHYRQVAKIVIDSGIVRDVQLSDV